MTVASIYTTRIYVNVYAKTQMLLYRAVSSINYGVLQRLKEVSSSKLHEAFSHEYKLMLDSIKERDYKLDLNNREWMFERVEVPEYTQYRKWNTLIKKILNIPRV